MKKFLAIVFAAILITVPCSSAFASSDNLFIGEEGNPVANGVWGYNEAIGAWGYATTELFTSVLAYIMNPYAGNEAQWFLFDENGILLSGWFNINGTECYFNTQHDGSFGAMIPGAKKSSGTASTGVELYTAGGNAAVVSMPTDSDNRLEIYGLAIGGIANNALRPLVIVDGIPLQGSQATQDTQFSQGMPTLNPEDIESITVLKDAAASGIYGSRAANGAIATIQHDDLLGQTATDPAAALQGKAAGVQVVTASNQPGQGATIRVRGMSSNSTGPYIIIE